MGRVMGCGLCPYNAIEKVGNYALGTYLFAYSQVYKTRALRLERSSSNHTESVFYMESGTSMQVGVNS